MGLGTKPKAAAAASPVESGEGWVREENPPEQEAAPPAAAAAAAAAAAETELAPIAAAAEDDGETNADVPAPPAEVEATNSQASNDTQKSQISLMPNEDIAATFRKYDVDNSGDLNTFELANAICELMGRSPTTVQVVNMIASCVRESEEAGEEAKQNNSLSLAQFTRLCKTFDWDGDEFINGLADTIYEHTFEEPFSKTSRLGFRVRNVDKRGLIVVSKIVDGNDALADKVGVNDTIIAVNGAPLGFVTDHSVLAKTIGKLSLPIRITFERYLGVSEQDSDLLTINSVTREDVEAAEAFEADAVQKHADQVAAAEAPTGAPPQAATRGRRRSGRLGWRRP